MKVKKKKNKKRKNNHATPSTQKKNRKQKQKQKKIVKVVKVYLGLSLVLWVVWGHFQGSSLCLTSSVCWSLQCLISILTQGGGGHTRFTIQSSYGEGGMLQTNITGVCLQCLIHSGLAPARGTHRSGST